MVSIKNQRADMLATAERLLDACDAEDRNMTDEETKHFDTLLFRVDHLEEFETYKKYSGFSDELIWDELERRKRARLHFNNAYQRKRVNEIWEQQSAKGEKKRGHKGPVNMTVGMIVAAIGSAKLSDVLDALEDEDDCLEAVFYSGSNPSPLIFIGIDRVKEKLRYEIRKTGEKKEISFGTLNNHLTDFR